MWRLVVGALAVAASSATAAAGRPYLGRPDDRLRRLFTPPHAPAGTFEVYVTGESIDELARRLAALNPSDPSNRSWVVGRVDLSEAFESAAGRFDRYRVASLYGGTRPKLTRGPLVEAGRVVASATLISPYPDPSLERLEHGTLIVILHLKRPAWQGQRPISAPDIMKRSVKF